MGVPNPQQSTEFEPSARTTRDRIANADTVRRLDPVGGAGHHEHMALKVLRADPFTRSELGPRGLEELSRNLWMGRCQTCGGDLEGDTPAVVVLDRGRTVTATLHHSGCQRQRWSQSDAAMPRRHLSTTVRLVSVPFGDPSDDTFMPTLLANPGLEEVTLACAESGRYRATTVDSYRPLGLVPPSAGLLPSTDDAVAAWLDDERLIVRCGEPHWVVELESTEQRFAEEIRRRGGVVLGISTAVHPQELVNMEPLKRVLNADDIAVVFVPLNTTEPPPALASHAILVDSELAHADETNDVDWLPPMPYTEPTYDPTSGRFVIGMGMDQPGYWRLNTPGAGVENGLIAGPPELGKTNLVRIVVIEALSSGLFSYMLADPLNRNSLVDDLGQWAYRTADTPTSTVDLLAHAAHIVDHRAAQPGRYRDPSRDDPGLLVALDDAQAVLRNPETAALAEHIATAGPPAGVSLVVSTASIELEDFGGRADLLRALSRTNAMVLDLDWHTRLQALRDTA
jgi:hypothetical protein